MDLQDIANLFSALRDGEIRDLELTDGNLQFQVYLPKLASERGEGFELFLCSLRGLKGFSLQPFRNESTEIRDLKQINKLQLCIERAVLGDGPWVRVLCSHRGTPTGARLRIQADQLAVWDEAFDPVTAGELAMLRGKMAGK